MHGILEEIEHIKAIERERCAKICERLATQQASGGMFGARAADRLIEAAKLIRNAEKE